MRLFWIFIISSFCWLSLSSQAQIALLGGTNFCWMRNDNLLPQQEVMVSTHLGISIQYFPFNNAPEISLENGFLTNTKGYHLDIDKDYYFRLYYYSFPLLLNYSVSEQVTLSTGLEFNYLKRTNVEQGTKTYNRFDMALVIGVEVFDAQTVNPYFRCSYGFFPVLNYYTFDKLGNLESEFRDLKSLVFSIGIKINLYDERIAF